MGRWAGMGVFRAKSAIFRAKAAAPFEKGCSHFAASVTQLAMGSAPWTASVTQLAKRCTPSGALLPQWARGSTRFAASVPTWGTGIAPGVGCVRRNAIGSAPLVRRARFDPAFVVLFHKLRRKTRCRLLPPATAGHRPPPRFYQTQTFTPTKICAPAEAAD
jgi:hypothetical protein